MYERYVSAQFARNASPSIFIGGVLIAGSVGDKFHDTLIKL